MEPFIHAILPLLILLALYPNLEKRYVWYLIPIVWIIDLDIFIGSTHRFLFHNIFFVAIIGLILYKIWDKKAGIVGFFYGLSHLILDMAYPGVGWFYPLYQKTIYIKTLVLRDSNWIFSFDIGTVSRDGYITAIESIKYSTWITEQPILILTLFTIVAIFAYRYNIKQFFSK
jgi:membrane-bound metal-dependent hydrolase YbcI (DUF457 family)